MNAALEKFGQQVRRALDEDAPTEHVLRGGRAQLVRRITSAPPRRRWPRLLWFAAMPVAAAAAWLLLLTPPLVDPSFTVAGAEGRVGDAVHAQTAPVALDFAEGSQVRLLEHSRLRVVETSRRAARLALESGRAELSIRKGRRRPWRIEAGSFAIAVTGTRFSVDFDPGTDQLEVVLHEGEIIVTGPCLPDGRRRMHAGERLSAGCRPEAVKAAPAVEAPAVLEPPPRAAPRRVATVITSVTGAWRDEARAGRFPAALQAAIGEGWDRLCQRGDAADLLELADVARLAGDPRRSQAALVSVRRRFPRTDAAARAGFSLGRLAFEKSQDWGAAAKHFAGYVAEAPGGPLVGDAWGRLLEARQRAGQHAEAREDARRYLERYPGGPYAPLARRLLER